MTAWKHPHKHRKILRYFQCFLVGEIAGWFGTIVKHAGLIQYLFLFIKQLVKRILPTSNQCHQPGMQISRSFVCQIHHFFVDWPLFATTTISSNSIPKKRREIRSLAESFEISHPKKKRLHVEWIILQDRTWSNHQKLNHSQVHEVNPITQLRVYHTSLRHTPGSPV